jgi:penicillin-binding protein 1A
LIFSFLAPLDLPSLVALTDYRPKIPLRVYSSEGVLIGEFGQERRKGRLRITSVVLLKRCLLKRAC